ncbi:MBOAT family protein [Clostridium sp. CM028]|uniref:MBOAT family O-acyltransferase n=1 Tax=unclassified Clostridium TaxID=2614128 RepID=UPI001C0C1EC6|nr:MULTISPECIES: MBOAT family O-acyltransferase [unclassified Clostridium]MBU3092775.1 MBOAT family protein [Clostridium sp. CF011]MBW9145766.1 MBOAT family protein [Clostridium sp. CM027]MBW9150584.1 MBOAT family protein [Clostridium sp. CM028]UVE42169.1 MBOAT family protein [Clostridium sp. CM027]WAG71194.1 MBOAT family protein [Clostridium sp. CF011]
MIFSSLFFTFAFLPITVILYYSLGKHFRNIVLLTASLFFYAWGEPIYVLLMCGSITVNYCLGTLLGRSDTSSRKRKLFLIISLVLNLGCLAYFKYIGMIISTIASIGSWNLNAGTPTLPIGISFYTFQTLSYVIDVYRGKIKQQKSLILFALYITMFPQLVAGPIVNYADIESQLAYRSMNFKKFNSGMQRFLCGLAKKMLLANNIGLLWSEVKAMPGTEVSMLMAWAGIIAFTLQIYFDFSGYSDMAIGLGKMFGFRFKENFQYPYISQSISEFWRRWHISLGSWFKEYVYISLGGNRVGKWKLIRNMFIVWFLTGLWHGASWNFVLWGLYFGALILIEKLFLQKSMTRWPKVVRHIYLLLFVVIGWVLFEFTNLTDMLGFLRIMSGVGGNALINNQAIVKLKAYAILYIVCIIAASPWPKELALVFERSHYNIYKLAVTVYYCVLMFFSTAYMVSSTYNPFIYFRF